MIQEERNCEGRKEERKSGGRNLLQLSFLYGIVFCICIYKNLRGIAIPVLMTATCLCIVVFLKRTGQIVKKETFFYMGAMLLAGISTIMTNSWFLIMGNWIGSVLLLFMILVHQFYEESEWDIVQYGKVYLRMLFAPFGHVLAPFKDISSLLREKKQKNGKKGYGKEVLFGLVLSLCLLMVIFPLLLSGDMVFATFIRNGIGHSTFSVGWIFVFLFGFVMCHAIFRAFMNYMPEKKEIQKRGKSEQVTGITVLLVLTVIYVFYAGIQCISLFVWRGAGLPEGYSYSEYARSGFFELLTVSCINLVIVLAISSLVWPEKWMRRLLVIFSACTYVMILSSGFRMWMYIKAYHFTMLRILVIWFLCVLSFIFAGVIVNVYRNGFPLFRYGVIVLSVFWLLFSLSRPDEWMAEYNMMHTTEWTEENVDEMLILFSDDALPVISRSDLQNISEYGKNMIKEKAMDVMGHYDNPYGRTYHIGKARARKAAEEILHEYDNMTEGENTCVQ